MAVNAIGGSVGSGASGQLTPQGLSIQNFLQLFLSQLQFQDPLKPVDNTQFLAQLAQFTNIEQTQVLSDNLTGLLSVVSTNQAVTLLGHTVELSNNNTTVTGTVSTVNFNNGQPSLTVALSGGGSPLQGVSLSQITLVR
jgi:flagellar basal-body rod modification protein FlgD